MKADKWLAEQIRNEFENVYYYMTDDEIKAIAEIVIKAKERIKKSLDE